MDAVQIASLSFDFGYSQVFVYDSAEEQSGLDWSDDHCNQGFARRESVVSFGTLLEFGIVHVKVLHGQFIINERYRRVVRVPFRLYSGAISIDGPDERGSTCARLPCGDYRLYCAQWGANEEQRIPEQSIDFYFENVPSLESQSRILVCDDGLQPPTELAETADFVELLSPPDLG